jgi:hypothetical protein
VAAARAHESAEVALEVVDGLDDAEDFHHGGLVPGAVAEVGVDGLLDIGPSGDQRCLELLQVAAPCCQGRRPGAHEGGALSGEQFGKTLVVSG